MYNGNELKKQVPSIIILRFAPLYGFVAVVLGWILSNYVVRTTQPDGLGEVYVPYGLTGLVLVLVGIGLVVFGAVFNMSNLKSIGIRRVAVSSVLISIGSTVTLFSVFGVLVDASELGQYSCGIGHEAVYPVCSSISSQLLALVLFLGVGILVLAIGLLPRFRIGKNDAHGIQQERDSSSKSSTVIRFHSN